MPDELALQPFLHLLNREADAGDTALQALYAMPITAWADHFASHPGWRSYGVFRAVLAHARDLFERDVPQAAAITAFVTQQVDAVDPVAGSAILGPFIRGLAWKEHANALYGLHKYRDAADAAARAIAVFKTVPALAVDVARATLLRAMSLHNLQQTRDALELIMESVRLFAQEGDTRGYLSSLQVSGGIFVDLHELVAARDAYRVALKIAEEQSDEREFARTLGNIGQCSVLLGELELGEQQLRQAFRLMAKERMDIPMLQAIGGLARAESRRGAPMNAISAFHAVYADLLHYGLLIPAAQVLVELTDVVTELTNDVKYARDECARLAEAFGDYDLPGNVRTAMAYVQRETAEAKSVPRLRAALQHVKTFFADLLASPSAAFAVPV